MAGGNTKFGLGKVYCLAVPGVDLIEKTEVVSDVLHALDGPEAFIVRGSRCAKSWLWYKAGRVFVVGLRLAFIIGTEKGSAFLLEALPGANIDA